MMAPSADEVIDAVLALRSAEALILDRPRWREFLAEHTTDGRLDPIGHAAWVVFAGLTGEELERYYERHPEAKERHQATARRIAAERFPEGSKIRELAEEGLVTPARRPDPEAIQEMRAMVRDAAANANNCPEGLMGATPAPGSDPGGKP